MLFRVILWAFGYAGVVLPFEEDMLYGAYRG